MVEAAPRQRFLVISNGHGEDWIASAIAKHLTDRFLVEAWPVLGSGNAYAGTCPIVGPRARLESGGARTAKGSLRRDLAKGGLATIPPALRYMRSIRNRYDRILVVGDAIVPLLAWITGHRGLYYVDCYKTGAARLYSGLERHVISRTCRRVFCRADNLAEILRQVGVEATAPGNLMMDTIPYGDYDAQSRRSQPLAVTLLPGSRGETPANFARQVDALRRMPAEHRPDAFLAVAGALIGFAGARVIEQTIREKLPKGFQRSEYLYEHGMVDMVVHRHNLRPTIGSLVGILTKAPAVESAYAASAANQNAVPAILGSDDDLVAAPEAAHAE